MGSIARLIRRWLLQEHVREHEEVDAKIADTDRSLNDVEVRLLRLEAMERLRKRRQDSA